MCLNFDTLHIQYWKAVFPMFMCLEMLILSTITITFVIIISSRYLMHSCIRFGLVCMGVDVRSFVAQVFCGESFSCCWCFDVWIAGVQLYTCFSDTVLYVLVLRHVIFKFLTLYTAWGWSSRTETGRLLYY